MRELGRYLVSLTGRAAVGEFGVKESVLDTFFPSGTCRLILVEISGGDSELRQISSISFFRDLTIL